MPVETALLSESEAQKQYNPQFLVVPARALDSETVFRPGKYFIGDAGARSDIYRVESDTILGNQVREGSGGWGIVALQPDGNVYEHYQEYEFDVKLEYDVPIPISEIPITLTKGSIFALFAQTQLGDVGIFLFEKSGSKKPLVLSTLDQNASALTPRFKRIVSDFDKIVQANNPTITDSGTKRASKLKV